MNFVLYVKQGKWLRDGCRIYTVRLLWVSVIVTDLSPIPCTRSSIVEEVIEEVLDLEFPVNYYRLSSFFFFFVVFVLVVLSK